MDTILKYKNWRATITTYANYYDRCKIEVTCKIGKKTYNRVYDLSKNIGSISIDENRITIRTTDRPLIKYIVNLSDEYDLFIDKYVGGGDDDPEVIGMHDFRDDIEDEY